MRPPVLICISDTTASYWIILAHLITGVYTFIYQGHELFSNYRGIGIWWEFVLYVDAFVEFICAAIGFNGFEVLVERALYPMMVVTFFRFLLYCFIMSTILLLDFHSNSAEVYLENVFSNAILLGADKENSMLPSDYLPVVFIMSLFIYPMESSIDMQPSTRAIVYMSYLTISMVFQGLSAFIIRRRIAEIKKTVYDKLVQLWMAEQYKRNKQIVQVNVEDEHDETNEPRMTVPQERCVCCPQFEFGCLVKWKPDENEEEDEYD